MLSIISCFTVFGYTANSDSIVLMEPNYNVTESDVFSLQYSQGWCAISTRNNRGESCAKVFFRYDVPTGAPTDAPSPSPTDVPTHVPTDAPTSAPSYSPTDAPSKAPTPQPEIHVIKDKNKTGTYISRIFKKGGLFYVVFFSFKKSLKLIHGM